MKKSLLISIFLFSGVFGLFSVSSAHADVLSQQTVHSSNNGSTSFTLTATTTSAGNSTGGSVWINALDVSVNTGLNLYLYTDAGLTNLIAQAHATVGGTGNQEIFFTWNSPVDLINNTVYYLHGTNGISLMFWQGDGTMQYYKITGTAIVPPTVSLAYPINNATDTVNFGQWKVNFNLQSTSTDATNIKVGVCFSGAGGYDSNLLDQCLLNQGVGYSQWDVWTWGAINGILPTWIYRDFESVNVSYFPAGLPLIGNQIWYVPQPRNFYNYAGLMNTTSQNRAEAGLWQDNVLIATSTVYQFWFDASKPNQVYFSNGSSTVPTSTQDNSYFGNAGFQISTSTPITSSSPTFAPDKCDPAWTPSGFFCTLGNFVKDQIINPHQVVIDWFQGSIKNLQNGFPFSVLTASIQTINTASESVTSTPVLKIRFPDITGNIYATSSFEITVLSADTLPTATQQEQEFKTNWFKWLRVFLNLITGFAIIGLFFIHKNES